MTPWPLEVHETLPSTSDYLRTGLHTAPLAVLARTQTAGRGRRGRVWHTPPGNLAVSVLMPALDIPQGHWALLAGLATIEALPPGPELKWPNDITLQGAKLAGVLSEIDTSHCILGIGVNITTAPPLADRSTACLASLGVIPTPETLAHAILARLAHWHAQLASGAGQGTLLPAWLARAHPIGTFLTLLTQQGQLQGRFTGLAPDGAIVVSMEFGQSTHHSAEIIQASPANPLS